MKISKEKIEKISEQILALLYSNAPKPLFTSYIAKEIARDEEFIKKLLIDLSKKKLVVKINRNSQGIEYIRRTRWKLSEASYNLYRKHQN